MMLRLRRYRAFLAVAIVVTFSLYHFSQIRNWDAQPLGVDRLKKLSHNVATTSTSTSTSSEPTSASVKASVPTANAGASLLQLLSHTSTPTSTQASTLLDFPPVLAPSTTTRSSEQAQLPAAGNPQLAVNDTESIPDEEDVSEQFVSNGMGRMEIGGQSAALEKPHWMPQKEHFPVPSNLIIPLPTGRPKGIPSIQHAFQNEDPSTKKKNEQRLASVKEAFKHAWGAYKKYAMPHDELAPISKTFRDPFNGWGATLVDTLDTLWIMDLKDEFDEAVDEVKKINFKTSIRKDIPLFETVIRYLGGLIAAYDVSLSRYPVLLEKAVELAEILMGAFDTPNRMPVTYYQWAPSSASQPHRAASMVVLAELGSLSLEFTRLAQLTKDNKYYDAIARITNELESWQNKTELPGLWPVSVDASGCKKSDHPVQIAHSASHGPQEMLPPIQNSPTVITDKPHTGSQGSEIESSESSQSHSLDKRQVDDAGFLDDEEPAQAPESQLIHGSGHFSPMKTIPKNSLLTMDGVECQHQGLAAAPFTNIESFTVGGMSDSAYEYLPKEWLLLGGLNDQYQTMYKDSMDAVRDNLLFRPMTKTGRDILFAGTLRKSHLPQSDNHTQFPGLGMEYDGQHLTCFAGGMFALGAKIFGIRDDLEIAQRLTDGCVWAYESTTTGIMPESFHLVPCDDLRKCTWNETKWWEALDPHRTIREQQAKIWHENQKLLSQEKPSPEAAQEGNTLNPDIPILPNDGAQEDVEQDTVEGGSSKPGKQSDSTLNKRQLSDWDEDHESFQSPTRTEPGPPEIGDDDDVSVTSQSPSPVFTPKSVASHEEYVKARIAEERLPPGFANINSKKYILRPEAIESVFIMFRVTGNKYWRDQGWKMFTAIQTYTSTENGNSAIKDVTSEIPFFSDEMESFWLAETLKYFYLLYSDPGLISLDDYVLNTEAHPFRRPS